MGSAIYAIPALLLGKMAWTSIRTGTEWTRFRQWDAATTNIAIGAALGGMATVLARRALPSPREAG
ncbi:MAG: hypothetical protein RIS85_1326 [Pseudomonadota bacterium]